MEVFDPVGLGSHQSHRVIVSACLNQMVDYYHDVSLPRIYEKSVAFSTINIVNSHKEVVMAGLFNKTSFTYQAGSAVIWEHMNHCYFDIGLCIVLRISKRTIHAPENG